eukprot:CAMPEP_0173413126 /NCGR_PEP_ID=MMETSP1356-20130122/81246_1 /TAXON_ID=77927 ORGANISM="Hemiselmis virescens, Strain PCC157" /NCGR_SAMPLE_ID=MMETSP1356 /ASSEMBLY_ACC=CAM_ASM_000847 /LENGTH=132 /DNA_ID=CAMNT_0014375117 /DNA_START=154 /DNA_END=548 /DNA_ORIENTATION=+
MEGGAKQLKPCPELARESAPRLLRLPDHVKERMRQLVMEGVGGAGREAGGPKCGIGLAFTDKAPYTVEALHDGEPAHCSEMISRGDLLVGVAGHSIADMTPLEVTDLILGDPGTEVELRLRRSEDEFVVWLL